jgi:hypothetical protein
MASERSEFRKAGSVTQFMLQSPTSLVAICCEAGGRLAAYRSRVSSARLNRNGDSSFFVFVITSLENAPALSRRAKTCFDRDDEELSAQ